MLYDGISTYFFYGINRALLIMDAKENCNNKVVSLKY